MSLSTTTDILREAWPEYYHQNSSGMPFFEVAVTNTGNATSDVVVLGFASSLGECVVTGTALPL